MRGYRLHNQCLQLKEKRGMVSLYQYGLKKGFNTSSWAEKNLFNRWVDACVFKLSRVMSQQPLRPQESKEGLRTSESSEIEGSRGLQLSPSMQDLVKLSLMDSSTLNADVDVLG